MAGSKRKIGALDIVLVAASALIVIGVLTFAGPCVHEDGSAAACTAASHGILAIGAAALVVSVVRLFISSTVVKAALALAAAVFGVAIALTPGTLMPLCMMETMRCQTIMKPVAILLGIVLAVFAVIAVVTALRSSNKPRRSDLA